MKNIFKTIGIIDSIVSLVCNITFLIGIIYSYNSMGNIAIWFFIVSFLLTLTITFKLIYATNILSNLKHEIFKFLDNNIDEYKESKIYKRIDEPTIMNFDIEEAINYIPDKEKEKKARHQYPRMYFTQTLTEKYPNLTCKKLNEILDIYFQ